MKNLFVIIIFLLFPCGVSIAEDSTIHPSPERNDAGSLSFEENHAQSVKYLAELKDQEKRREEEFWKTMKKLGYEGDPNSQAGDPNWVEDTFTIPPEEQLSDCGYAPTDSFPGICTDGKGNVVFDYGRGDGQEVLDKIIKKQGKQGKYNKLPKERKIDNTVRSPMTSKILVGPPPTVIMPRWEDRVKDVR